MKIGSLENKANGIERIAPAGSERREAARSGSAQRSGDASTTVELSSTAAALSQQGPGEASFDQAKVERIAQAIRDGKYQINAEAIADKLIANAQELLGKSGS